MSATLLSKVFKATNKIDKILLDSGAFDIGSRAFALKSLEGIMEYSVAVKRKSLIGVAKKVSFDGVPLRRLLAVASPGFLQQKAAISKVSAGQTGSYLLDTLALDKNAVDLYFTFEIEQEIEKIVEAMVRRDHQAESIGEDKNTYWLHAQLRELEPLIRAANIRRVDLDDIPFVVNVSVHQDVKTKFPPRREQELEVIANWARELERGRKQALSFKHLQMKRQKPKEKDIASILNDLQNLFSSTKFRAFVDVLKEFYYSDCFRGADFYEQIPFKTFPKWMSVICRTDLSIDKPASEGELVYRKGKFQEAVEEAISRK